MVEWNSRLLMRYTKMPAHTITIGSVSVVMPFANSGTTVAVGPNHQDVTTAGDKALPKSVGV